MKELDKLIKQGLKRRELLPGVETGRYESPVQVDKEALRSDLDDTSERRDSRINIRVSGKDLTKLQKQANAEGIPLQSLIAHVIHQYVQGTLVDVTKGDLARANAARVDAAQALPFGKTRLAHPDKSKA